MKQNPPVHRFPSKMREERERQQISQTDLAAKTGFQPSAISHFERGTRDPTLTNAVRIANGLRISLEKLI